MRAQPALAVVAVVAVVAAALALPARAGADAPDEARALDAVTIPSERSPSPKAAEWSSAVRVRATRAGAATSCRIELLREWLRVRCPGEAFAISLLGGDGEGIAFWIDPASKEGEVLMPVRRGGKHVFQFWKAGKDRAGGFAPQPLLLVQEYWLEGAAAPTLTIL